MFRSILASITMYSIVFFALGQTAFVIPQVKLTKSNLTKVKSCASCSTASANPLDRLATIGRQTQSIELLPVARSQAKGFPIEFVGSSSGELAFAQTDIAFKDNPLLVFQRTYLSSRTEDFGLGRGWSFAFNDSIALNNNSAVLTNSVGDSYTYRRAEAKHYILQPSDSTDVKEFNVETGNTISAKNGDITKVYKRTDGDYYLSQIIAPGGFEVTINRNSNGKIRGISSLSGEISFDWSNGNNAKLLSVTDNTGRQVSFGQSNNSLQNATTATGGKWQYEYVGGKLSNIINAANKIVLRAKYDASGRAIEIGDAVGLSRLAYETNSSNVSTRTTFTDSLGYARVVQHNARGILTNVSDAQGTLLNIQYDEGNRPTQLTDVSGATATFDYDAQKRLARKVTADGDEEKFEYDTKGKLTAVVENGERTELVNDENGNLTRRVGKNSRTNFNSKRQEINQQFNDNSSATFEYDNKGRKNAVEYSDIGRFERTFDSAGRKISEKMPSGFAQSYEYDASNRIVRESNNRGGSRRLERDASGNITKVMNANGDWVQLSRDEAGRIEKMTNWRGQSRRFIYNSRGALTRFIGADGRDLLFQYNERGEMQGIFNEQTARVIYKRNQGGNLAKIQQNTSQKNFFQIQKINYSEAFTSSAIDDSCFFDDGFGTGGDGWGNWDNYFAKFVEAPFCYDPFSGMSGGGGGGAVDNCYDGLACADKALVCLLAAGAVIASFIALAACPETFGATCILALILHPVAGGAAGTGCALAIKECQKPTCIRR